MAAPTLPTLAQLQSRFDNATNGLYPHYSWVPPVWDKDKPTLEDTVKEPPVFTPGKHPLNCVNLTVFKSRLDKLKSKYGAQLQDVVAERDAEDTPNSESNGTDEPLKKVPHPHSDFSHVDNVFDSTRRGLLFKAADNIKKLMDEDADRDGELSFVYSQIAPPLNQAIGLLKDKPRGMQRLKLVFEWTLCQATTIFGEINAALEDTKDAKRAQNDYELARIKFLELLKDLDDHEPQTKGKPRPSPGVSGYGLAVKWAYILPLIHDGKIRGAKIVAKWNPHISSSGIPIPHP